MVKNRRTINALTIAIASDKIIKAQADNTLDTRKSAALATGDIGKRLQRSMNR